MSGSHFEASVPLIGYFPPKKTRPNVAISSSFSPGGARKRRGGESGDKKVKNSNPTPSRQLQLQLPKDCTTGEPVIERQELRCGTHPSRPCEKSEFNRRSPSLGLPTVKPASCGSRPCYPCPTGLPARPGWRPASCLTAQQPGARWPPSDRSGSAPRHASVHPDPVVF